MRNLQSCHARFRRGACLAALVLVAACSDDPCGGAPPADDLPPGHVLLDPESPELKQVPPDSFDAVFETTQGEVRVRVYRDWAPMGAFRFYNLARAGFYDGARFFRVVPGFVAQFGLSGRPQLDRVWSEQPIPDDPRRMNNGTGTLTYAKTDADSRTTQLFFNLRGNPGLDEQDFAPIGRVVENMGALFLLYSGYGDTPPQGSGPEAGCIISHGNRYLDRRYDRLDAILRVRINDL
jgi:peptidyl-prolyl cis-trans isomerase A (cyclophilin A)